MNVEIWHNPRCSKSRQTLELLEARGLEPAVVHYLEAPPTKKRLREVLKLLGMKPFDLVRRKEPEVRELGLTAGSSADEVLDAMVAHPRIIERPVVITAKGARIGRPPDNVLDVL